MINSTRERTTRISSCTVCLSFHISLWRVSNWLFVLLFFVHVFVIKRQQLSKTLQTFQKLKTEDFFDFGTGYLVGRGRGAKYFFFQIQTQTSKICIEKYSDVFFPSLLDTQLKWYVYDIICWAHKNTYMPTLSQLVCCCGIG